MNSNQHENKNICNIIGNITFYFNFKQVSPDLIDLSNIYIPNDSCIILVIYRVRIFACLHVSLCLSLQRYYQAIYNHSFNIFIHTIAQSFFLIVNELDIYKMLFHYIVVINFVFQDTRTHVVVELYDTERSYVEALQILVNVSRSIF